MIVDFHTHIFHPGLKEHREKYLDGDSCFQSLYSSPAAKVATAEDLVSAMDKDGIDISVALNFGWQSHELCVETNNYILDAISRYPDRLVGFCAIQPLTGEKAIYEMERCARAGFKGVGELRPDAQGFDLADKVSMAPIAEAAKKLGLILLFHTSEPVGHDYKGKGQVTPDQVYRFITAFPGVSVVCAHWGGGLPFYALMPEVATAFLNAYFDTAATPLLYKPQIYRSVSEIIGSDKILFGSDYPLLSAGRLVSQIRSVELGVHDTNAILGGNAQKLLKIG
ncbi:MAG: amidohydrolase family protein [Dehalococcoidia bacterium]|nr:amidohydrolase family protein [Dehalococcoidia bacterium]